MESNCYLSVLMIKNLAFLGQPKESFIFISQYSSSIINSILKRWQGNIQSLVRCQRKCTLQGAAKQPFAVSHVEGKLIPITKPGPKYSSNRRNIAVVQLIQDFLYRDKTKDKVSGRNWT